MEYGVGSMEYEVWRMKKGVRSMSYELCSLVFAQPRTRLCLGARGILRFPFFLIAFLRIANSPFPFSVFRVPRSVFPYCVLLFTSCVLLIPSYPLSCL